MTYRHPLFTAHTLSRCIWFLCLLSLNAISLSHAAPPVTHYEYDANGNLTKVTDGLGNVTVQHYDALNRMVKQQQPHPTAAGQLGEVNMQYNSLDQLISVTDPNNKTTQYTRNVQGQVLTRNSPDTGTTTHTYDNAGNLKTKQDGKGQVTTYSYDVLNRLTQSQYADGQTIQYSYDDSNHYGIGRLSQITDITGTTQYQYNARGQVTQNTRQIKGQTYTTSYTYNANGQLTNMTYPTGLSIAYSYDALGQINGITSNQNGSTATIANNIQYQPFGGGIKSFSFGNGSTYHRQYDPHGRLTSYTLYDKTITLSYDAANRITQVSSATFPNYNQSYTYDNLSRLTDFSNATSNKGYTYDLTGNRTSQRITTTHYNNQIASTNNQLISTNGPTAKTFTYDANGSLTNDSTMSHQYDARGRMIQTTTGQGQFNYGINALGQRVSKTHGSQTTVYHYDLQGQLIAETDAQGTPQQTIIYLGNLPLAVMQ